MNLDFTNLQPPKTSTDEISLRARRAIRISVLSIHFLVVVVPLVVVMIMNYFNPPLIVHKVSLVESVPNQFDQPSLDPSADNPDPSFDPAPPSPLPELPEPDPEPEPEPQAEPTPVPEPQPEPQKVVPPQDKVPPPPDEKKVKKKEKEKEKEKVKKPSRLLDAKDIVKSTKRVKTNNNRKRTISSSSRQKALNDALNELRRINGNTPGASGKSNAGGYGGPKGLVSKDFLNYYDQIQRFLYPRWNQPDADALNGRLPEVVITLCVESDGRLRSAVISRASNIPVMDESVRAMIRDLSVLPVPPRAMAFSVTMRVSGD